MKTQIIFFVLSFFSLAGMAQNLNQIKIDDRVEGEILCGQINLDGLKDSLCADWFKPEFEAYKIDTNLLSDLKKKNFSGLKMTLVLGTWCHDSHQQVPRLIKLLETMKFPMSKLEMFAMDTYKEALGIDLKSIDVKLVPTLIVYKGTKEIGRIVESPKVSLEADLLEILQ
ncbi:hypothetical protein EO244_07885 [Ancylomarina salipaludis]|uniref:Thioredoxin n=1 Tax=Ancylomarina salipaludis TaxID=2501299 RepID=A0A4Q1JLJ4_9BACT|nr:hypothetical protein [Ancylomarina salipaludis]RXQ94962.1 hypothetical protein EO244_07885 [Ancylomarina salipaludis]